MNNEPFILIDNEDVMRLNIRGAFYELKGSFDFYENKKVNTYSSGELDGYDYIQFIFSMHIERKDMSIMVYQFLEEKADMSYRKPIEIHLLEEHKLYEDCSERRYWFEGFCFNSGLDSSIQFYLKSEDLLNE